MSENNQEREIDANNNLSSVPLVIKFAYTNFTEDGVKQKWSAKCAICRTTLVEKVGVTSGFTK